MDSERIIKELEKDFENISTEIDDVQWRINDLDYRFLCEPDAHMYKGKQKEIKQLIKRLERERRQLEGKLQHLQDIFDGINDDRDLLEHFGVEYDGDYLRSHGDRKAEESVPLKF